jgi:hypothetical protein
MHAHISTHQCTSAHISAHQCTSVLHNTVHYKHLEVDSTPSSTTRGGIYVPTWYWTHTVHTQAEDRQSMTQWHANNIKVALGRHTIDKRHFQACLHTSVKQHTNIQYAKPKAISCAAVLASCQGMGVAMALSSQCTRLPHLQVTVTCAIAT